MPKCDNCDNIYDQEPMKITWDNGRIETYVYFCLRCQNAVIDAVIDDPQPTTQDLLNDCCGGDRPESECCFFMTQEPHDPVPDVLAQIDPPVYWVPNDDLGLCEVGGEGGERCDCQGECEAYTDDGFVARAVTL